MKKRLPSFLATCLAVLLLSTACSKANPDPITGDPGNIVKQGTWKISLYNDKGTVKTSLFSGYTLVLVPMAQSRPPGLLQPVEPGAALPTVVNKKWY